MPTTASSSSSWRARAALTFCAALAIAGCSGSHDASAPTEATPLDSLGALTDWALPALDAEPVMLTSPTYDSTGQAVHPDVALFPNGWNGFKIWMTMTPYPGGSSMYENPSLLTSDDGIALADAPGVINPLIKPLQYPKYNSDPDLVYEPRWDQLVMSYRVVADGRNSIYTISSPNGRDWSDPRLAFDEPNHSAVSQSMVPGLNGVPPLAWYVDAGTAGCTSTNTSVRMRRADDASMSLATASWSSSKLTDMAVPGYLIWHLKVRWVAAKREFWALIVAYPNDGRGCGSDDLFLAHSKNGVHWETLTQPLLRHEDRVWTSGALYRGTFLYDATLDQLLVWFSARDGLGAWHLGFTRMDYTALAARLNSPSAARNTLGTALRPMWFNAP